MLLGLHDGTGDPKGYGYDFPAYLNFFKGKYDIYGNVDDLNSYTLEMPYYYMCKFLRLFGNYDFVYIFGCALIFNIPFLYIVNKYSNNKPLSILLLFIIGHTSLHLFVLSVHRQMVANTFFLLAVIIILNCPKVSWKYNKKQILLCFLCLFIAVLSHSSSYLLLPILFFIYFININSKKLLLYALVVTMFLGVILSNIMNNYFVRLMLLLGDIEEIERSTHYFVNDVYGSTTSTFTALLPLTALTFIFVMYSNKKEINSFFLKCIVTATIIINLFYSVPLMTRSMTTLLLLGISGSIPQAIGYNKKTIYSINIIVILLIYIAYRSYTSPAFRMLPFKFIWE